MQHTAVADIETEMERLRQQLAARERELHVHRERLRRQLELAANVHRSLLPKPIHHERIFLDLRYLPIEQVGGDYCQVKFSDRETLYLTISDVTGHGIGPALLATRVSSEVRYGILYGRPPRDIIRSLNTFICDHFSEAGLYLSFLAAQIDLARRRITWSGAGHPAVLLIHRGGTSVQRLRSQNMLVGVQRDIMSDEPEHSAQLATGDRLLFYTDGLTETADSEGRQLGLDGLAEIAAEAMSVELFDMADLVLRRVAEYQHEPTDDDMTLIVAEIR
ncbi:MAG: serine/threonine-protein phosphatase [Pirellulales bacterium]|nr:serine/threonine-protein phosphatase [Pirellulales bacterium]